MPLFIELLPSSPTYLFFMLAVLGLIVGSFLNVVIYRLPIMMEREWQQECEYYLNSSKKPKELPAFNLAVPRSACPNCGRQIKAWENIPVLSYLFLGGKCAGCRTPISIRYPLVELAGGALAVIVGLVYGATIQTALLCIVTWALLALTMIDIDKQLLPDAITLPMLWAGLIANSFEVMVPLQDAVWGAIGGYLSLWMVHKGFKLITGKEGMGYGDFKLLAALGAWLGGTLLLLMIILSSVVGIILAMLFIVTKRHGRSDTMPFGPSIAIAGIICMLWGQQIVVVYQQWAGLL